MKKETLKKMVRNLIVVMFTMTAVCLYAGNNDQANADGPMLAPGARANCPWKIYGVEAGKWMNGKSGRIAPKKLS